MPKVSVIVPVYGVEDYIEKCARSLFEQTLDKIEYIFIDDCTPDNSIDIVKKVLKEYPHRESQVIFHKMKNNSGQAAVREWGIQNASGEYIIHCDSDDWVDIEMYQNLYNVAIETNADIVISDLLIHDGIHSQKRVNGCISTEKSKLLSDFLYQKISSSLCNKLVRRGIYNKIEIYPKDNMGEDMLICLQLLYISKIVVYINQPYYYYYKNAESLTKNRTEESFIDRFNQFNINVNKMISYLASKSAIDNFHGEINWLKYSVKSSLGSNYKKCKRIWRRTYPFVEFKVLLDSAISKERKRNGLITIFKNYLSF